LDVGKRLEIPVYDLYAAMGGANSMKDWSQLGMTDKKQIHFSPKGYRILGESMAHAIQMHLPQSISSK
jgi:lysophospholipase L1-like esterase